MFARTKKVIQETDRMEYETGESKDKYERIHHIKTVCSLLLNLNGSKTEIRLDNEMCSWKAAGCHWIEVKMDTRVWMWRHGEGKGGGGMKLKMLYRWNRTNKDACKRVGQMNSKWKFRRSDNLSISRRIELTNRPITSVWRIPFIMFFFYFFIPYRNIFARQHKPMLLSELNAVNEV